MAPKEEPALLRFVQIVAAPWHGKDKVLNHSIYALSEFGGVYKHTKRGWQSMGNKLVPEEQADDGAF